MAALFDLEECFPYMQRWRREGGAVPPVIARRLGEEGCRMLADELAHCRDATGDEILTIFIPGMVKGLLELDKSSHRSDV